MKLGLVTHASLLNSFNPGELRMMIMTVVHLSSEYPMRKCVGQCIEKRARAHYYVTLK